MDRNYKIVVRKGKYKFWMNVCCRDRKFLFFFWKKEFNELYFLLDEYFIFFVFGFKLEI